MAGSTITPSFFMANTKMRVSTLSVPTILAVAGCFTSLVTASGITHLRLRLGADEDYSESHMFWLRELQASGQASSPNDETADAAMNGAVPDVASGGTSNLLEQLCLASGGSSSTDLCCTGQNYPDTCLIGACGCGPDDSEEVPSCECGEGDQCFSQEAGCISQKQHEKCLDTDGQVTLRSTCGGSSDPFPTECLATGEEGGPYDCDPGVEDTPVCNCGDNDCWVKNVGCAPDDASGACLAANGEITLQECCSGTSSFPNLCLIGACGCGPDDSEETVVCSCPGSQCWDGEKCVENQN